MSRPPTRDAGAPRGATALPPPRRRLPGDPRRVRWELQERRRFRGAALLLAMTLVVPGSAQLVAGNRRVGRIALGCWVGALLVVGLIAWRVPLDAVAGWFVRSWVLTLARALAVLVAGAWIALLVDAWRLGHPPTLTRRHRLVLVAGTIAASLLVAVPLGYAARYAQIARDEVLALFPEGDAAAAADGRLNVLLLGGDAAPDRPGVRTDSVNLASIDVRTGRTVLFALPRNLQRARFAEGTPLAQRFPDGFRGERDGDSAYLLNAVYTYGVQHPDLLPGAADPGAKAVEQAVAGTLGLPVHYYVLVNLFGFRDLIDALGGVTVDVSSRVPYTVSGEPVTIEPGVRHLTGRQTLIYTRSRTGSSDYARMGRQRCVLGAILKEADPLNVLRRFESLAASAKGLMATDIPRGTLPDMIGLAVKAKDASVRSVAFTPPLIQTADPDVELIQRKVREAIDASQRSSARPRASRSPHAPAAASAAASGSSAASPSRSNSSARPSSSGAAEAVDAGC